MKTALIVVFFATAAIASLDKLLRRERASGDIDAPKLSKWVFLAYYAQWAAGAWLLFLNWKLALFLFALKFILNHLGIMEFLGGLIAAPFDVAARKFRKS
jgi:hypothetical protein